MMIGNILKEDIETFVQRFSLRNDIREARVLVTGGTGLIGSSMVRCLSALGEGITITIPVRDETKARLMFNGLDEVEIIGCDLLHYLHDLNGQFDYIVHCASPTAGKYMENHPVETYTLALESTKSILEYGRNHAIKSIVYVSSIEYYGQVLTDQLITESYQGYIDISSSRSSYPMGKRAAEFLCMAYAKQYGVPVRIARLTQTFGAGISNDDNRVFAQFARSIIEGKDIVLHTSGESSKPYLYTTDCVEGLLFIMLKGKGGEAYNVSNDDTYISIRELAEFLCAGFNSKLKVCVELHPEKGYAPLTMLHLSSAKLRSLGWCPHYDLYTMFERLIKSLMESK